MQNKILHFSIVTLFLIIFIHSFVALADESFNENKSASPRLDNPSHTNMEWQRQVLTVRPREIDFGLVKAGETSSGRFSIKNLSPTFMEWSASCPEGWEDDIENIRGTVSDTPTSLQIDLLVADTQEQNMSERQAKNPHYQVRLKMLTEGKEIICRKALKAGPHRKAIRFQSPGGKRTVFLDFRIPAMQEEPSISLNPQRLDLGVQTPGKIISKRIELSNRGKEMLRWSIFPSKTSKNLMANTSHMESYSSLCNDQLRGTVQYMIPDHLKDSIELIGKWSQSDGFPLSKGFTSALKYRFQGTGISVFMQSHSDDGSCSIYLDDALINIPDGLSGQWEKKEIVVAEDLPYGFHTMNIIIRDASLEIEGVKVFGKEINRGPRGWIKVFPNSGTTFSEIDYINVQVNTSNLSPGYYSDQILFKSNVGEEIAEVYVDIIADAGQKLIDVFLYSKDMDYLLTSNPQAEARQLIQNGYIKEGIAFRLFSPQTAGTTGFHRWYNPIIRDHYYHYDRNGGGKKLKGYVYEGNIGNIATSKMSNTKELYRWHNPITGKHYFSTNPKGASGLRKGYRFEGIAGYVR